MENLYPYLWLILIVILILIEAVTVSLTTIWLAGEPCLPVFLYAVTSVMRSDYCVSSYFNHFDNIYKACRNKASENR